MRAIYLLFIKVFFDCLVSGLLILMLSPLFFLITILLVFHYWGSPFYVQSRIGKGEKPFRLIKFRTFKTVNDYKSISWLGGFLRKTSIDELPQLYNVLRGDMSLVGPRPLLPEYLPFYTDRQNLRHTIRPGLTGLAQITLGNSPDWHSRFECDVTYVNEVSFWFDIRVLMLTLPTLVNFKKKSNLDQKIVKFNEYARNRR